MLSAGQRNIMRTFWALQAEQWTKAGFEVSLQPSSVAPLTTWASSPSIDFFSCKMGVGTPVLRLRVRIKVNWGLYITCYCAYTSRGSVRIHHVIRCIRRPLNERQLQLWGKGNKTGERPWRQKRSCWMPSGPRAGRGSLSLWTCVSSRVTWW